MAAPGGEPAHERTIVCFGDSNTHGADPDSGARFPREVRWPVLLASLLGPRYHVVEEGLNGRTTVRNDPYSPGRNGAEYLQPCLWSHAPVDLVTIMLGTNDLKAWFAASAVEIAAGAGVLVDLARTSLSGPGDGPPGVLLICPAPIGPATETPETWGFGEGVEKSRRLAPLYRQVAEDRGVAFLDAGEVAAVSQRDGIHLDATACRTLAAAVARRVVGILESGMMAPPTE